MAQDQNPRSCCSGTCDCSPEPSRRSVLQVLSVAAAAAIAPALEAFAGPFTREDFDQLVPADKKLKPEWVQSLFARGNREVARGAELDFIGMPVGGLCAGQLYLGGDGKLWHWDIFNQKVSTGDGNYSHPPKPAFPVAQGFAVRINSGGAAQVRTLDRAGFSQVTFSGEYPIGIVEYTDPQSPVSVTLEAFSPFVPLNTDDSSLPATVMQFKLKNTGSAAVEVELGGWLQHAVCLQSGSGGWQRQSNVVAGDKAVNFLEYTLVNPATADKGDANRPDIVFEDFQKPTYEGWTVTGTAFGSGPMRKADVPKYQGDLGAPGDFVVNSHASAPGKDTLEKDAATGTLTSKTFTIERNYINFFIGGGNHPGKTCLNVLVGGKVIASATGPNDNKMVPASLDVRGSMGQQAQLQIVDNETGAWGNIGIARIVFTDKPAVATGKQEEKPDYGTMGLGLLRPTERDRAIRYIPDPFKPEDLFTADPAKVPANIPDKCVGAMVRALKLEAGAESTVSFVLAWRFPNLSVRPARSGGRYYAKRFASAADVAQYIGKNFDALNSQTHLWHDTWYDSTLPYWFLNRTFLNTSILATSTSHRFADGRFWGWEGVGCCHGTCTHVWHYAHAPARIFPELERNLREVTDFAFAFNPQTGLVQHRGWDSGIAVDGQAGIVLRSYREHQMSADDAFLKRNWVKIKRAIQFLIDQPGGKEGILNGAQHNTLDAAWFGPVAWLSGLYLAALRAGEEMAKETGDAEFAQQCRSIFEKGQKNIVESLFDGDYFINKPDPKRLDAINSGTGCEIDQVFGQSWAFQVNLGRVLPLKETYTALQSLWKYNFSPDVGPYRQKFKSGRWYAMTGEAGLLMCTFPRTDWDFAKAGGKGRGNEGFAGYFNECMNGFEYQAAGHMIWEGMVQEGLAVTRAIHDRYHPARRNPYNEVECGDHYARSMASYGVYLAACGFEYHGPKGHIGFAPRLTPRAFKAAFTVAEGWGTYSQTQAEKGQVCSLDLKQGKLRLKDVSLVFAGDNPPAQIAVNLGGKAVVAAVQFTGQKARVSFDPEIMLNVGDSLKITIS